MIDGIDGQSQLLARVALAMAFGALVGFERELANKPAGLRTHMLVAGAAALLVLLGHLVVVTFDRDLAPGLVQSDPLRVISAVITGVSFLGAGMIVRHGPADVEGLTTAASLLLVTATAVAVAVGEYFLACGVIVFTLLVLRAIAGIETFLARRAGKA